MAQSAMTVRLDSQQKSQFDSLCEQFGMSANAAINIFVNAVVRTKSIPFSICISEPNATTIKAIEDAKAGRTFKASSVDDLLKQCLE